jgi:Zn-dependent metalloprotease
MRSIVIWVALAGCGPSTPDPTADAGGGTPDPLSQLEADTGARWRIRWHPDIHTPAFLEGKTDPLAATPKDAERAARAFLLKYAALYQLSGTDELKTVAAETDELGMTHARFRQQSGQVPVWGCELIAHFAADGSLVRVNGRFQPLPSVNVVPTRTADVARVEAVLDARMLRPELDASQFTTVAPKLWVYPTDASSAKLVWRVEVTVDDQARPQRLETFVDAEDASIVHRTDVLAWLDGTGVGVFGEVRRLTITQKRNKYWLEDAGRGGSTTYDMRDRAKLPGRAVESAVADTWDTDEPAAGAAVDAHANVATTWSFFAGRYGREGFDGKGTAVRASVHFGGRFAGAFFDGKHLVFGDGDGRTFLPASAALDVVAHEFSHGVIASTAQLGLEGESGALHEALADVFGCLVDGNWQLGETIFRRRHGPAAIRDLADPHASGHPAHVSERVDTTEDNGGIHVNSTIASHAAYLMKAKVDIGAVWYRALTRYLTSRAGFADAADATRVAASDLGSDEQAVRDAWVAVGVTNE